MAKKEQIKKRETGDPTARLSGIEFLIMSLVVDSGASGTYGLQLVEKSEGKLKKGTVYVLLGRLEDKQFIEGRYEMEGSAIPRKIYKPTAIGRKVYDAWRNLVSLGELHGTVTA